jgi:hypothetical protein
MWWDGFLEPFAHFAEELFFLKHNGQRYGHQAYD